MGGYWRMGSQWMLGPLVLEDGLPVDVRTVSIGGWAPSGS